MTPFNFYVFLISLVIYSLNLKGEFLANSTKDGLEFNESTNSNFTAIDGKFLNSSVDVESFKELGNQSALRVTVKLGTSLTTVGYKVSSVTSSTPTTTTEKKVDDVCFITKEATSGHIHSPVNDGQEGILQCDWIVIVPQGHLVKIKFTEFDLPGMSNNRCRDGFLLYGSFDDKNRRIIGHEFCGKNLPEDFTSVGNKCWIYYQITGKKEPSRFELLFNAIYIEEPEGSNLSLMALLVIIIPILIGIFVCYIIKKRREEQRRTEAEIFERFRRKHMRNRTLLLTKKSNPMDTNDNNIRIKVSKPSNDLEKIRRYFDSNISEIKGSGEYQMVPGHFCVRRVMMPSGISTDGSVFLSDTPEEENHLQRSTSFNCNTNNFLSIPSKFNHKDPIPSYLSFRQPCSVTSINDFDPNLNANQQTTVAMVTKSIESLESIPELPPYKDPPVYHGKTDHQLANTCSTMNGQLPYMVSDTSVFSNEHPLTLDRKKKRRTTSFMTAGNRKRSRYNTISWNDATRSSFDANAYFSSDSNTACKSYRPGSGHHKFLSTSSITGNYFMPASNLQKGKWDDTECLNETGYRLSPNNCCSMQNLSEMREMCKTMPVIHVSSYSSIFEEHNTMAYSRHSQGHLMSDSSSMSNNDIMSLINEEGDTSETTTTKEFDNPAFVMDETPKKEDFPLKFNCSMEENKSLVDINNNTEIQDNGQESRSFVLNEFYPGENNVIVLDRGETMV